jgi:DNA-binding MarR family transcriptional regulator
MDHSTLDTIAENLFYIVPLIHKKLLRINIPNMDCGFTLSRLHIGILGLISEESALPISEIAKKYFIPKSRMSLLINQLVKAGMVERHPNTHDRRVSNITLTPKGQALLKCSERFIKINIKEMLSFLNENELKEFSQVLAKLRSLGARLDKHG